MTEWVLAVTFGDEMLAVASADRPDGEREPIETVETSPTAVFLNAALELLVGRAAQARGRSWPSRFDAAPHRLLGGPATFELGDEQVSVPLAVEASLRPLVAAAVARHWGADPIEIRLTCPDSWPVERREGLRSVVAGLGLRCLVRLDSRAVALAASQDPGGRGALIGVVTLDHATTELVLVRSDEHAQHPVLVTALAREEAELVAAVAAAFAAQRAAGDGPIRVCCVVAASIDAESLLESLERELRCLVPRLALEAAAGASAGLRSPSDRLVPDAAQRVIDDDVQFTIYRPRAVCPERWYTLLAFAHKTDSAVGEDGVLVDPRAEVEGRAQKQFGRDRAGYLTAVSDGPPLPRGSEIRFVPEVDLVEFDPPQQSFRWAGPVHEQPFQFRADARLDGQRARGRMAVYAGCVLVGQVGISFRVGRDEPATPLTAGESARRYRKIFVSYSHLDADVVDRVEAYVAAHGDAYLRDVQHLRAGELWDERLVAMIREADVFQLFWSSNSMRSPHVRREWTYALELDRPGFVRPVYWEDPLPSAPELGLPPDELLQLHFAQLPGDGAAAESAPRAEATSAPVDPPSPPLPPPPAATMRPPTRGRPRLRTLTAAGGGLLATMVVGIALVAGSGARSGLSALPAVAPTAGHALKRVPGLPAYGRALAAVTDETFYCLQGRGYDVADAADSYEATLIFDAAGGAVAEVRTFGSAELAMLRDEDAAAWLASERDRDVVGSSVVVWRPAADALARAEIAGCLDR